MLIRTVTKYTLVAAVVVLTLASPTEGFSLYDFFFGWIIKYFDDLRNEAIQDVTKNVVGGGTAIVTDAIMFNYFGIGPALREWAKVFMIHGVGTFINVVWYIVTSTISTIITTSISASLSWKSWVFDKIKKFFKDLFKLQKNLFKWVANVVVPMVLMDDSALIASGIGRSHRSVRSTDQLVQVLRGRREVGWRYDNLESAFTSANLHDPMECLPLVLCAIHADPENLVSPMESKFRKAFRSFFSEKYSPVWAAKYLKATEVGESSKSVSSCQAAYPSCIFSPRHLRILISQAMDDYWNKENLNEVQS